MKKLLLVLGLMLMIILSACAQSTPEPAPVEEVTCPECPEVVEAVNLFKEAQNGKPIRFIHDNDDHPVVRIMTAGFLAACEDYGLECVNNGCDGACLDDVVSMMETAVGNSAGVITPIYQPAHYQPAMDIIASGIPVISTHFPQYEDTVPGLLAFSAPDNVQYALAAGHEMAKVLDCEGPVGLTQSSLNDGENAVAENFSKALLEDCPDIEILEMQVEGFDQAEAILVASSVIQANPEIKGAFSTTGNGPTTWAKAAEENGLEPGQVKIISMDYSRQNLDLVKSGEVYMLVGQPLFEEHYFGTVLLLTHIMGAVSDVPYENFLPAPMITIENVDKYYAINDLAESVGQ